MRTIHIEKRAGMLIDEKFMARFNEKVIQLVVLGISNLWKPIKNGVILHLIRCMESKDDAWCEMWRQKIQWQERSIYIRLCVEMVL